MDLAFESEYVMKGSYRRSSALTLSFNPEHIALSSIGDRAMFTLQAVLKREGDLWDSVPFASCYPLLFGLHGILYNQSSYQGKEGIGANLRLSAAFPLAVRSGRPETLNLAFHCSRAYLQYIEEQRATILAGNPGSPFTLGIAFWATMNLIPQGEIDAQSQTQLPLQKFIPIKTEDGKDISISRSHWADILSPVGFPARRSIELPVLKAQEGAEILSTAIEQVQTANAFFAQDRYRQAVQHCRQAIDALLGRGNERKSWCEKVLAPKIGSEKAKMIDESILALNRLGIDASHADAATSPVEIDRDVASYVIGSLTLILDYIGRKML